jgi:hypothetical protein
MKIGNVNKVAMNPNAISSILNKIREKITAV